MTDTPNYDINYEDERFTEAETWRTNALDDNNKLYDGAIKDVETVKEDQINAANSYAAQQSKNAQERTDFTIEQINQQKDQAKKDYTKEQSGAYVDWQKQSNEYGANAEAQAAQGMAGTGYSESSQVAMYNQYQNRVATARESYTRAVLNYDNAIKDAQLQNNALLAEIAYQALQTSLEATIAAMQQKNTLLMAKASDAFKIESMYDTKYQNVLAQMNEENKLKENVRQFEADDAYRWAVLDYEKEQAAAAAKAAQVASDARKYGGTVKGGTVKGDANKNPNYTNTVTKGSPIVPKTYDQAAAMLNKNGIEDDGGLMTKDEWSRRKTSGSNRAPAAYDSYEAYLSAYVTWALGNK